MTTYAVTNGSKLNWNEVEGLASFCPTCFRMKNIDGIEDVECEGHDIMYFEHRTVRTEPFETTETLLEENYNNFMQGYESKPILEILDWYILHTTNGNIVELFGEVSQEYMSADFFVENDLNELKLGHPVVIKNNKARFHELYKVMPIENRIYNNIDNNVVTIIPMNSDQANELTVTYEYKVEGNVYEKRTATVPICDIKDFLKGLEENHRVRYLSEWVEA